MPTSVKPTGGQRHHWTNSTTNSYPAGICRLPACMPMRTLDGFHGIRTFPVNWCHFVDRVGTACAVGHLMRLDGQEELVGRIAANSNHVRIEDVDRGPLIDWIGSSGLTQEECALIQPSYATIEDYRLARPWQDEVERLRAHFAQVEETLRVQSQQSLGEALITKLDAELQRAFRGSGSAAMLWPKPLAAMSQTCVSRPPMRSPA